MEARTYNPKKVVIICGGHMISGFADGTVVTAERNEDAWTLQVGTDGETVRSKTNNRSGRITIELLQSSFFNDILSGLAYLDEATDEGGFEFLMKDLSGRTLVQATFAWIVKLPNAEFGRVRPAQDNGLSKPEI